MRSRIKPNGNISATHECSVICGPIGCAIDFVCRLLHLKIISLKKPLQIGLCNKAVRKTKHRLKDQGIDLITYHRKNMQSIQLSESDGYHLKQRNKIETLFSLLKGQYNLVTSKSRSISGFLSGIYASLCAYQLTHQNKPKIQIMGSMA